MKPNVNTLDRAFELGEFDSIRQLKDRLDSRRLSLAPCRRPLPLGPAKRVDADGGPQVLWPLIRSNNAPPQRMRIQRSLKTRTIATSVTVNATKDQPKAAPRPGRGTAPRHATLEVSPRAPVSLGGCFRFGVRTAVRYRCGSRAA
jgi:hypothetical protein